MRRFVQRTPHGRIMADLLPDMGQTEFLHWGVDGSSVPADREEAKRRMRERQTDL